MENYKPLIEDKKENIDLFSDIIESHKFSKYSNQLSKVLSNYSKFYENLTKVEEKKKLTVKEKIRLWLSLSDYSNTLRFQAFDINKFKSKMQEMENKDLSNEKRKKMLDKRTIRRKILSKLTENKVLNFKNKIKGVQNPCIGVYNPKYDSVGKHIYQVTFDKSSNSKDKYNSWLHTNIKSTNVCNIKKCKKLIALDKYLNRTHLGIKFNKKNLKDKNKLKNSEEEKRKNKTTSERFQGINNNSKFLNLNEDLLILSKIKRKKRNEKIDITYGVRTFQNNNSIIKDLKGNVNFEKISSNKNIGCYFEELAKKNNNPPVGLYRPRYSTKFDRTTNIYFTSEKSKNNLKIQKKNKNKILTNFNPSVQYELFDFLNKRNAKQ